MENEKKLGKDPAFPFTSSCDGFTVGHSGISKRLYIATQIAAAIESHPKYEMQPTTIASRSYLIADELLRQENL